MECRCFLTDFTSVPLASVFFPTGSMLILTSPQSCIMCRTAVAFFASLVPWSGMEHFDRWQFSSRRHVVQPGSRELCTREEKTLYPPETKGRTPHAGPVMRILVLADHVPYYESVTSWDGTDS